jgi:hypothetical protein
MSEWLSRILFTTVTTVTRLRVLCEVRAETEDTVKEWTYNAESHNQMAASDEMNTRVRVSIKNWAMKNDVEQRMKIKTVRHTKSRGHFF